MGAHERRKGVFVGGGHGVHGAILSAAAHGVGRWFAMGAAQRGFLRAVCSWSRGGEGSCSIFHPAMYGIGRSAVPSKASQFGINMIFRPWTTVNAMHVVTHPAMEGEGRTR